MTPLYESKFNTAYFLMVKTYYWLPLATLVSLYVEENILE